MGAHPEARERILDAAEELFAAEGFKGASMRAITGNAGVNLASVNYYFGSKEGLLNAVLDRRLQPLNEIRQARLEAVRVRARLQGTPPPVAELLRAFIEPTLFFRDSNEGCRSFVTLIGRILTDPEGTGRSIFLRHMGPLLSQWLELFGDALPHIPRETILWRIHFVLGALTHTMRVPAPQPSETTPGASDLTELLVSFLAPGMEASP